MASGRTIAIGDVHGCIHALEALVDAIALRRDDRLVFLGDVVDHGRNSREVLERLIELQSRCNVTLIEGNHEQMMLEARTNETAQRFWENCGGVPTLNSYRFGGKLADVPDEHWRLLDECIPYYETADVIFTHANYQADEPMTEQLGRQLRWALFEPEEMQPHMSGKRVIVGHTEQRDGEIAELGFAACIDTACWRDGWLTAVDVDVWSATTQPLGRLALDGKGVWQASRWGMLREPGEAVQRERLAALLTAGG